MEGAKFHRNYVSNVLNLKIDIKTCNLCHMKHVSWSTLKTCLEGEIRFIKIFEWAWGIYITFLWHAKLICSLSAKL